VKGAVLVLAALALAAALGALPPARAASLPHEQQRIEQLLDALAADRSSRFVRNGGPFDFSAKSDGSRLPGERALARGLLRRCAQVLVTTEFSVGLPSGR
jgi:hypothetical protein